MDYIPASVLRFPFLESLWEEAPSELDLTSRSDLDAVDRLAEALLGASPTRRSLETLVEILAQEKTPVPLALGVAAKLALSKAIIGEMADPGFVSVVFAVYKEHNRIRTSEEHPHGENFRVRKLRQLHWLFDDNPRIGWELIVVKTGSRNSRGKLFIYLWKRLVSVLPEIVDTQCAFKAFRADVAREIVAPAVERKFAFDIELLIKTALLDRGDMDTVALAWIDSEAASTTTDIEPYLAMLQSIVRMYREYLPPAEEAESFAGFIESLDEESWDRLCDHIPAEIAGREPFEFGTGAPVSPEELAVAAGAT